MSTDLYFVLLFSFDPLLLVTQKTSFCNQLTHVQVSLFSLNFCYYLILVQLYFVDADLHTVDSPWLSAHMQQVVREGVHFRPDNQVDLLGLLNAPHKRLVEQPEMQFSHFA